MPGLRIGRGGRTPREDFSECSRANAGSYHERMALRRSRLAIVLPIVIVLAVLVLLGLGVVLALSSMAGR